MSMHLSNGAGYARMTSSITNIDQGGGMKKAGLVSTVGRRYSSYGPEQQTSGGCTVAGMMVTLLSNVNQARPIGMRLAPSQHIM